MRNIENFRDFVASNMKLVVFDFDGVFTDNNVYVAEDGKEFVLCSRGDGMGIKVLKEKGIPILVLSSEINPVVSARCKKLGIECIQGSEDKLTRLTQVAKEDSIGLGNIMYVGNDINDASCLQSVGLPVVVSDSHEDVMALASYITKKAGGKGAVREVCDLIVSSLR
jgi:3-deoxy-D-manno-octulosonate 8-phosphate phosphatase, YrbI family